MTGSFKAIDLCFTSGGRQLIDSITLSFEPGILYAVLGPNGAGKSTLLKALAGIWNPTSGSVLYDGSDLSKLSRQEISRIVTLVPQQYSVPFQYTVGEMVQMGRYARYPRSIPHDQVIAEALKAVDAGHLIERPFGQLSQGERQRVLIARALATEASVLLFDEPTSNLDLRHQVLIWELLRRLAASGKVVIVTVHDLTSAQQHCPQMAMLNHGRCEASGPTAEVLTPDLIAKVLGVRYEASARGELSLI